LLQNYVSIAPPSFVTTHLIASATTVDVNDFAAATIQVLHSPADALFFLFPYRLNHNKSALHLMAHKAGTGNFKPGTSFLI